MQVPLHGLWPWSRRALLVVDPMSITVRVPGVFAADRPWRIALGDAAVVDLGGRHGDEEPSGLPLAFLSPVTVAYLANGAEPDLLLLFRVPQRLPRVGLVAGTGLRLPVRAARTPGGAWVDGVAMRTDDPAGASAHLVRAGVESTDDPTGWLVARRETTDDGGLVHAASQADRRTRRLRLATGGLSGVLKGRS